MKAIVTKYIPASNTKPSRIKAKAEGVPSVTITYSHDGDSSHREAALALCREHGWGETLISGGMPDQSGEVFVFADSLRRVIEGLVHAAENYLIVTGGVNGVEDQRRSLIAAENEALAALGVQR